MALRILAGAEVLDISDNFGVGYYTSYSILHDTVEVMACILRFPKLPRFEECIPKTARDFKISRTQFNPLDKCVGARDGICIKLKKPKHESITASFHCRKGYYAIAIHAVCDTNYVFRYIPPVFVVVPHKIF